MIIDNAHSLLPEEVLAKLLTTSNGLDSALVKSRLQEYGYNEIYESGSKSIIRIFVNQFINPFIYLLLIATLISLFLHESANAYFILAVMLFNAIIGTYQEHSAQRATLSLKKMIPQFTEVIRASISSKIATRLLVPGDIVRIKAGDKVPADIRLLSSNSLTVDESMLTGESLPINKNFTAEVLADATLGDHFNMLYSGTIVGSGVGTGVVVATGNASVLGNIACSVAKDETMLPLARTIKVFTLKISFVIILIVALFIFISFLQGESIFEMLLLGVALAVCVIPESLPATVTVALSIGMKRLAAINVIVRRLLAVESLGACNLIASDKTGTITINVLTIQEIILNDGCKYIVNGVGLERQGSIVPSTQNTNDKLLHTLCISGILTNESKLQIDDGMPEIIGDMVDAAFLVLMYKNNIKPANILNNYKTIDQINYESERAFGAGRVIHDGVNYLFVKGSPEKVLSMCGYSESEKYEMYVHELAKKGYKVIALAMRTLGDDKNTIPIYNLLQNLTWLGFVGMSDPIRPGVINAIEQCKQANIDVRILTGDHPTSSIIIAEQLRIANNVPPVTGQQLKLAVEEGEEAVDRLVANAKVFARIEPNQKLTIVNSLMKLGYCVAVTGDGANDAPALKHADVGIAMGKRGTDVARECADIILLDDNFSSIVNGIAQGRLVFANIRKAAYLLITIGAAELFLFLLSLLFKVPMPLTAVQLLWLNLLTGGLQEISLAFEPLDTNDIQRPPRGRNEEIFDRVLIQRIITNAIIIGGILFVLFYWVLKHNGSLEQARNNVLLMSVIFESVLVINCRSERQSVFVKSFFSNKILLIGIVLAQGMNILAIHTPVLKDILQIQPVNLATCVIMLLAATISIFTSEELHKYLLRHK